MSYILEALKKAQAERQLGSAPTIHAPHVAPAAPVARAGSRKPLAIGLGAGALVVAAGAVFLWRSGVDAPHAPVAAVAAGPAASATPPGAMPRPAPVGTAVGARQAPAAATTLDVTAPPTAAPVMPAPRAAERQQRDAANDAGRYPAGDAAAPGMPAARRPAPDAASVRQAGSAPPPPSPAGAPQAPATASARPGAPEDSLPLMQQLPDAVQREIPRVAFGGYMYSANPADRLLLVDRALRHEGEEVAPGLVLEKLLPKAAVMNYRGMRYRVGL
jgi:general secretion pathway protein B